jgi:hypothetical protein
MVGIYMDFDDAFSAGRSSGNDVFDIGTVVGVVTICNGAKKGTTDTME